MKYALSILLLVIALVIVGTVNQGRTPHDPAMLELYQRVGTEWMKKSPEGVASVEVSDSSLIISIKYEYAPVFDRSQIPTHQRQLLRAVLAEIKAKEMVFPRSVWVSSGAPDTGETGKQLWVHLGHSYWYGSTDMIKFEKNL